LDPAERDGLLPGENPRTAQAGDARHWARVYAELISFNRLLAAETRPGRGTEKGSSTAAAGSDSAALAVDLGRFRRRLAYWERRLAELGGREAER
jgi:hypothetical protein